MKTDIKTLQDSFKLGHDTFLESRKEATRATDYFHNRQYDLDQLNTLATRGQPAETFNVIKLFSRLTIGYYSTILNTVKVEPVQINDINTAALLNDGVDHIMRNNSFEHTGDDLKLDGLLSGIMCLHVDVVETGTKDSFGRPINRVKLEQVNSEEVVLDPMSRKRDYSDGRFLHRFRWLTEEKVEELFGTDKMEELQAFDNHLNTKESEFANKYNIQFQGEYKVFDNYLVVHTVITDNEQKVWEIFWSGDTILSKKEVTYKDVKPYRVQKIHNSNKSEYYGMFREILESQDAINQALIKIQLMANSQKAFVQTDAVEDMDEFVDAFNRVTAVMEMQNINGVRIENLTREVADQYTIIDKAFDRIQQVLGINDSFLGQAFASDSGRKVKLQQNQTIMSLRYITSPLQEMYTGIGWDCVNLMKQYYYANQILRIVDESVGERWIELNRPEMQFSGKYDPLTSEPIMVPLMEEVLDPENNEPLEQNGAIVVAPIPTEDTDIAFSNVDITIEVSAYNDEDEKNQLFMETFLSGPVGQNLSQANPAGYFKAASLGIKTLKTRYSPEISAILEQTSQMLSPQMQQQMQAGQLPGQSGGQQAPKSAELKLPQNTNEGA